MALSLPPIHFLDYRCFNSVLFWRVRPLLFFLLPLTSQTSSDYSTMVISFMRTQNAGLILCHYQKFSVTGRKSYHPTRLGLRYKCLLWRCARRAAASLRQTQIWCFRPSREHPPWARFLPAVLCLKWKHQIQFLIMSISKTSSQHTSHRLSICVDHPKRRKITFPLSQLYSLIKTVRCVWQLQKKKKIQWSRSLMPQDYSIFHPYKSQCHNKTAFILNMPAWCIQEANCTC